MEDIDFRPLLWAGLAAGIVIGAVTAGVIVWIVK